MCVCVCPPHTRIQSISRPDLCCICCFCCHQQPFVATINWKRHIAAFLPSWGLILLSICRLAAYVRFSPAHSCGDQIRILGKFSLFFSLNWFFLCGKFSLGFIQKNRKKIRSNFFVQQWRFLWSADQPRLRSFSNEFLRQFIPMFSLTFFHVHMYIVHVCSNFEHCFSVENWPRKRTELLNFGFVKRLDCVSNWFQSNKNY